MLRLQLSFSEWPPEGALKYCGSLTLGGPRGSSFFVLFCFISLRFFWFSLTPQMLMSSFPKKLTTVSLCMGPQSFPQPNKRLWCSPLQVFSYFLQLPNIPQIILASVFQAENSLLLHHGQAPHILFLDHTPALDEMGPHLSSFGSKFIPNDQNAPPRCHCRHPGCHPISLLPPTPGVILKVSTSCILAPPRESALHLS